MLHITTVSGLPYLSGKVYNVKRFRSALSYHSPNEFQELLLPNKYSASRQIALTISDQTQECTPERSLSLHNEFMVYKPAG